MLVLSASFLSFSTRLAASFSFWASGELCSHFSLPSCPAPPGLHTALIDTPNGASPPFFLPRFFSFPLFWSLALQRPFSAPLRSRLLLLLHISSSPSVLFTYVPFNAVVVLVYHTPALVTSVSSRQLCLEYRTLLNDFKLCRFSGLLDPSLAYFDHPQYDLERILLYGPWEDDPTIVPSFSPPVEPLYVVDSRLASALSTRHFQQLFDSALLQHNMVSEIRHAHSSDNVCSPLLRPRCATASIAGGTLPYDTLYSHRSTPWSMGYSPPSSLHCAYAQAQPLPPERLMTMYRSELNNVDHQPSTDSIISIILDTGCSFSCTFDERDFVGPIIRGNFGNAQGISGTSPLTARGIVRYTVFDPSGVTFSLTCPAFLMPASNQRLLSPQQYAQFHSLSTDCSALLGPGNLYGGNRNSFWFLHENKTNVISIPIHPTGNLPVLLGHESQADSTLAADPCSCHSCSSCCTSTPGRLPGSAHGYTASVLDPTNLNLTSSQKQLLLEHHRLGHLSFPHLQELYRETSVERDFDGCSSGPSSSPDTACLPNRSPSLSSCSPPLCLACQASKARCRPSGSKHSRPDPHTTGSLSFDVSRPGELVSVDHYESAIRGRLLSTRGREDETTKHCGGTIFYDHYSGFVSVHHQPTLGATDTIKSKRSFEIQSLGCGNVLEKFRTDMESSHQKFGWIPF